MIMRQDNYDGFKCFDFSNDTDDTAAWLFRVGRNAEALELQAKGAEWFRSRFNYGKKENEPEQREHETPE